MYSKPLYAKYPIQLFNSLSGEKEIFTPITEGQIGMYVCGPTVYSNVHLGNIRTFTSFDLIYRTLIHFGYQVRFVRNITDAGHLTDDGNIENDRFIKQSRLEKLEPMEVVQKYTIDFHNILKIMNLLPPNIEPTATGHIVEQIQLTEKLIEKGFAYESNGSIYFDVKTYNDKGLNYGILSNRNIDELINNTRDLDGQGEKKNPQDFALWKKASPAHIMRWNSPWGEGFPGWHLECTAMSTKYLGDQFDIHGGGMDLKFPHHECEIAQGNASNGNRPVNYWMHANMLTMNGQRMSKSTGNFILPMQLISGENDFFEKAFSPSVIRFYFMQSHYRSVLDISNEALLAAEKGYKRLLDALDLLEKIKPQETSDFSTEKWLKNCYEALADDFNSPILIANLFEAVKIIQQANKNEISLNSTDIHQLKEYLNTFIYTILGLEKNKENQPTTAKLDQVIQLLIQMRAQARVDKNFALSDQIRNQLASLGIILNDGREGTTYEIN